MNQRKKNHSQFVPYAAPAPGYDPNQALFGQPSQPVQQSYQPGYAAPTTQPYQQQGWPVQPGQPTPQPYQQGQPIQPMQQPFQPGYAEPTTQPYQQPYNNQQGWPGQGV